MVRDSSKCKLAEDELHKMNDELEKKNAELQKTNKLFVGRELRMVELKERIKELESNRQERSNA